MKAEIKSYYSTDVDDLENYKPEKEDCFGFPFRVLIGPEGEEGEESLDFMVCTPKWLMEEQELVAGPEGIFFGKEYIIMFEYDFEKILNYVKYLIDNVEEGTWGAIGEKLTRYGFWEFEDHKEGDVQWGQLTGKIRDFGSS